MSYISGMCFGSKVLFAGRSLASFWNGEGQAEGTVGAYELVFREELPLLVE